LPLFEVAKMWIAASANQFTKVSAAAKQPTDLQSIG